MARILFLFPSMRLDLIRSNAGRALHTHGGLVVSGELLHGSESAGTLYLGFSGGGFDEIRARDGVSTGLTLQDGSNNAFTIDSIELASGSVPEPTTLLLLGIGLAGLGFTRRRLQ